MAANRKTATEQDKYDNLLLNIVQHTGDKVEDLAKNHIKMGVELRSNTRETKRLTTEVQETNGNVKQLQADQTKIKEVVFPEKPIKPSELQSVWRDPLIRKVIFVVGGIIILAAIGFNNEDIKGFFNG